MKAPVGKIIVIGFMFEVLFLVALIVVVQGWLKYSLTGMDLTVALFIGVSLCGLWLGKKVPFNQVLHGMLVGVVTVLVYVFISVSAEIAGKIQIDYDFHYVLNHLVKVLGGAFGGFLALRKGKSENP